MFNRRIAVAAALTSLCALAGSGFSALAIADEAAQGGITLPLTDASGAPTEAATEGFTLETTTTNPDSAIAADVSDEYSLLSAPINIDTPFAVAAVTWKPGDDLPDGSVIQMRTLDGDEWSEWYALESDSADGKDTGEGRAGTEYLVSGNSTGIQVRLNHGNGSLPSEMAITIEYGGEQQATTVEHTELADVLPDAASLTDDVANPAAIAAENLTQSAASFTGTPITLASAHRASTVPMTLDATGKARAAALANIQPRSAWGADNRILEWTPVDYAKFEGVVVHHTAGSNTYTQAQVPGVIQSIYRYHAVTREWGDIGYNVLIDKYGGRWEGRYGTLASSDDKMAVGAHAAGRNTGTMGISVMGDFTSIEPSWTILNAIEDVTAWKFAVSGIDPNSTSPLRVPLPTERRINSNLTPGSPLPRIVGHRDVGSTACPARIYNYLDTIRSEVTRRYAALKNGEAVSAFPEGWNFINGAWYFFDKNANAATGWFKDGATWYYAESNGIMQHDRWVLSSGRWFYLGPSGAMVGNTWLKLGGTWYYFSADGAMATGWFKDGVTWYYADANGAMVHDQWILSGNQWYYLSSSGAMMADGWLERGGTRYYIASDGTMATGWFKVDDHWYFADESGATASNRWLFLGERWYYVDSSGHMLENTWSFINGQWYYFAADGTMMTGWFRDGTTWYFADASGAMLRSQWLFSGGNWYYLSSSGAMATNTWIGDYFVGADGVMYANTTAFAGSSKYSFDRSGRWTSYWPGNGECPAWASIKGSRATGLYYLPGIDVYQTTKADECFARNLDAENAGYRAP
ncbi:N-acetylmuramoyl-L-alanine amidase [Arcanobacterium haemolyticum]|nr:N-acetylmuramoyl-L-alanine amidase [Arcanobacterium haemolyticum]